MLNKTNSIVLHNLKFGESSLIVALYTEKYGRISCMVHQAKSKKSRLSAPFFQPLSLLEVDLYFKENREIQRFKEVNFYYHYTSIPFNISKSTVALFLAEVLYLSLREEETNPPLFSFIIHALQLYDLQPESNPLFHPWFLIHLTRYLGFLLPADLSSHESTFEGDSIIFKTLSPDCLLILKQLAENREGPPELHTLHVNRNELLDALLRYYAVHVDGFSRIKSFKILQQVFDSP